MAIKHFSIAIALAAGMASAARSQTIPSLNIFDTPVKAPLANPFTAPMPPMGPQLPHASQTGRPDNANGTAPFYPTQIEQAYGMATLQGGLGTSATTNAGAGQTIAIIDAYHYNNALLC